MTSDNDRRLLERLTFFSDAVFAIAMTLLVIDVRLPAHVDLDNRALAQTLVDLLPNYIGFLSSFLVIARFWYAHHQLFGMLERSDGRLVWANLVMLLVVAFLPFPTAVLAEYVQLSVGTCFYAAWLTLLGVVQVVLTRVALGGDRRLVRADVTAEQIRWRTSGSMIPVALGLTAFIAGLIQPLLAIVALALGSPLYGRLFHRRSPVPAAAD